MASSQSRRAIAREVRRIAVDALAAFALFVLLAGALGSEASHAAQPAGPALQEAATTPTPARWAVTTSSHIDSIWPAPALASSPPPRPPHAHTAEGRSALYVLAALFSAVVAFTLATMRHLARVYVSPRRGTWREG